MYSLPQRLIHTSTYFFIIVLRYDMISIITRQYYILDNRKILEVKVCGFVKRYVYIYIYNVYYLKII